MSTHSADWRRRLLSPPPEDQDNTWHVTVAAMVAMGIYGLLLGSLLDEGVAWWLAAVAPFGWTVPLVYITANLLNRRRE